MSAIEIKVRSARERKKISDNVEQMSLLPDMYDIAISTRVPLRATDKDIADIACTAIKVAFKKAVEIASQEYEALLTKDEQNG